MGGAFRVDSGAAVPGCARFHDSGILRDSAQLGFDNAVSRDNPATATLNGNKITIVEVILETVK